jgi:surface antigen
MKRKYKVLLIAAIVVVTASFIYKSAMKVNPNPKHFVGEKLDSLNGVYVYYNGGVGNVEERNKTEDGYNLGLKYQCVEFVKRYYYEHYKHKMPDSYGHAKDFFDETVQDGTLNKNRNLLQFRNAGKAKPQVGDLMIFDGHPGNPYGHVAIVSQVWEKEIEIIQQNPGPFASSRARYGISMVNDGYFVEHENTLGWLRMRDTVKAEQRHIKKKGV